MIQIVYVAAPVGADTVEGALLNIARAERWFRALALAEPGVALLASWLPYVKALDDRDPAHRARGIRDDHAIIERTRPHGIVLVGGRFSSGMRGEQQLVASLSGWTSDLTDLGAEPPAVLPPGTLGMGLVTWARRVSAGGAR